MAKFEAGEPCLLYDAKGRTYLIRLEAGGEFQYHRGVVSHDAIIGEPEGCFVAGSMGSKLVAVRPRLADYVLKMPRGAAVVYPKDTAAIVMWADIYPGATVLEAGTGSGALTIALLRAVGPSGRVISVERREDHADHGRAAIERWAGGLPENLELRNGSVEEHLADVRADRLVLDLPEPWHALDLGAKTLPGGAVAVAYVPTTVQLQQTVLAMRETGAYTDIDAFETMERSWHVGTRSVRPSHQMVGHTGFLVVARKLATAE